MLFLRMGPRYLFIHTNKVEELKKFFINVLGGKEVVFVNAAQEATEDNSIIFITDLSTVKRDVKNTEVILLINEPASICFLNIINSRVAHLVEKIELGPGTITMRAVGDKKILEREMLDIYGGEILPLEEAINKGEKDETILHITHQQLSKPVTGEELLTASLKLSHPASKIFKRLRNEGILFITRSLKNKKWYELRINIYDVQGRYEEHYNRLNFVLNQLELGMVLEEGWTRDHALSLFSVLAYQVKLFTFHNPDDIKRILIGLEYNPEGKRWVDLDLYYRNKKISWVDIDARKGRRNKAQESLDRREAMLGQLSDKAQKTLFEMEKAILQK